MTTGLLSEEAGSLEHPSRAWHLLLPHHGDIDTVGSSHSCEGDPTGQQGGCSLQKTGWHQCGRAGCGQLPHPAPVRRTLV